MRYIGEKIYFGIIHFPFLFLLKFFHLTTMLSIGATLKIKNQIDRTSNNQKYINAISPNRKIKRR